MSKPAAAPKATRQPVVTLISAHPALGALADSVLYYERYLIGAALNRPEIYPQAARLVKPQDFHHVKEGRLWAYLAWAHKQEISFDSGVLAAEMHKHPTVFELFGSDIMQADGELFQLAAGDTNALSIPLVASKIRELANRVQLAQAADSIRAMALDPNRKYAEIVADTAAQVSRAIEVIETPDTSIAGIAQQRLDNLGDVIPRYPTGFNRLDEILAGGLVQGQVAYLCGYSGSGKTTLAVTIARNLAATHQVRYYTLEMGRGEIFNSFAMVGSRLPLSVWLNPMNPELDLPTLGAIQVAIKNAGALKADIVDSHSAHRAAADVGRSLTPADIDLDLQLATIQGRKPVVAVFDGIWLMQADEGTSPELHHQYAQMTLALAHIAAKHGVALLVLQQYKGRPEGAPTLDDVAGGAAIGRNAQLVMGLYRTGDDTCVRILKARSTPGATNQEAFLTYRNYSYEGV